MNQEDDKIARHLRLQTEALELKRRLLQQEIESLRQKIEAHKASADAAVGKGLIND